MAIGILCSKIMMTGTAMEIGENTVAPGCISAVESTPASDLDLER